MSLPELEALANPEKAAQMATYHKAERVYLGVANPQIDTLVKAWRKEGIEDRLARAAALWDSDVHEGRIAAAKLLTQARIKPDDTAVWDEIQRWVPMFDAWAIADHAASAGSRRLSADPSRIQTLMAWTTDENMWVRRAALVFTLPWTKQNHPSEGDLAIREQVLGWAAGYVPDHNWFIQKSIAWWLRSLSRHDPERVKQFLSEHGADMKPFAQREAARGL